MRRTPTTSANLAERVRLVAELRDLADQIVESLHDANRYADHVDRAGTHSRLDAEVADAVDAADRLSAIAKEAWTRPKSEAEPDSTKET